MKEDRWLNAQEAFDFGLIDEIYKGKLITNAVKFKEMENKLKNMPNKLRHQLPKR